MHTPKYSTTAKNNGGANNCWADETDSPREMKRGGPNGYRLGKKGRGGNHQNNLGNSRYPDKNNHGGHGGNHHQQYALHGNTPQNSNNHNHNNNFPHTPTEEGTSYNKHTVAAQVLKQLRERAQQSGSLSILRNTVLESETFFGQMPEFLDESVVNVLLDCYGRLQMPDRIDWLMSMCGTMQISQTPIMWSVLLKSYGRTHKIDRVLSTWEQMRELRHGDQVGPITYGCFIDACVKGHRMDQAWDAFQELKIKDRHRNTVIFSTLIKGLGSQGNKAGALKLFEEMKEEGITCNTITYNSVIDACVRAEDMETAQGIFDNMECPFDIITVSTLIKGYMRVKNLDGAVRVFNLLKEYDIKPDELSYNTLLDGCVRNNCVEIGKQFFCEMVKGGLPPSQITFAIFQRLFRLNGFSPEESAHQISLICRELRTANLLMPENGLGRPMRSDRAGKAARGGRVSASFTNSKGQAQAQAHALQYNHNNNVNYEHGQVMSSGMVNNNTNVNIMNMHTLNFNTFNMRNTINMNNMNNSMNGQNLNADGKSQSGVNYAMNNNGGMGWNGYEAQGTPQNNAMSPSAGSGNHMNGTMMPTPQDAYGTMNANTNGSPLALSLQNTNNSNTMNMNMNMMGGAGGTPMNMNNGGNGSGAPAPMMCLNTPTNSAGMGGENMMMASPVHNQQQSPVVSSPSSFSNGGGMATNGPCGMDNGMMQQQQQQQQHQRQMVQQHPNAHANVMGGGEFNGFQNNTCSPGGMNNMNAAAQYCQQQQPMINTEFSSGGYHQAGAWSVGTPTSYSNTVGTPSSFMLPACPVNTPANGTGTEQGGFIGSFDNGMDQGSYNRFNFQQHVHGQQDPQAHVMLQSQAQAQANMQQMSPVHQQQQQQQQVMYEEQGQQQQQKQQQVMYAETPFSPSVTGMPTKMKRDTISNRFAQQVCQQLTTVVPSQEDSTELGSDESNPHADELSDGAIHVPGSDTPHTDATDSSAPQAPSPFAPTPEEAPSETGMGEMLSLPTSPDCFPSYPAKTW